MAPAPTWRPRPALRAPKTGVGWLSRVIDAARNQWGDVASGGIVKRGISGSWMEIRELIGWEKRIDAESSQ